MFQTLHVQSLNCVDQRKGTTGQDRMTISDKSIWRPTTTSLYFPGLVRTVIQGPASILKPRLQCAMPTNTSLSIRTGTAIDTSLATWQTYLETVAQDLSYDAILADDAKTPSTKVQALRHLLESLPARYAALRHSYCDPELEIVMLSDQCAGLLEELDNAECPVELSQWFNFVTSKRFISTAVQLEKEMREEEQSRLQEVSESLYRGYLSVLSLL